MASVIVKSRFCDKTHRIDVSMKDDSDLSVSIDSDCENVRDFAKILGDTLTMQDVTDRTESRLFDPEVVQPLTLTCLVPIGILDAAWLEMGMMSVSRAKLVQNDEISFELLK